MKLLLTKNFQIAVNEYGYADANNVCILLPGRLDTKDYANFISHGNLLTEMGYYVIAIDAPGTWDSPGDLANYNTTTYIQVVNELIELLGNRPTVLLGHSRGGATAMLASSNPHVSALILINAAFGIPSAPNDDELATGFLKESRDLPPGDIRTKEQKVFMLPMNYFTDGNTYDPAEALLKYTGPALILQATKDEFANIEEIKGVYKGLLGKKVYTELNCTHDYRLSHESIDIANQAIRSFLNK